MKLSIGVSGLRLSGNREARSHVLDEKRERTPHFKTVRRTVTRFERDISDGCRAVFTGVIAELRSYGKSDIFSVQQYRRYTSLLVAGIINVGPASKSGLPLGQSMQQSPVSTAA
jgi:hypothetical protein